jgi:uncharacterized membrane protein YccC
MTKTPGRRRRRPRTALPPLVSQYQQMFGEATPGSPSGTSRVMVSGDPRISRRAARRAARVLQALHEEEYRDIQLEEAGWLEREVKAGRMELP